jgi:hypothetical protein
MQGRLFLYKDTVMKKLLLLLVLILTTAGCRYTAPLVVKQGLHIDPTVLGRWQMIAEADGKPPVGTKSAVILNYSDTEYLIRYQVNDKALFMRGYPIKIGSGTYVQLQLIGTQDGNVAEKDRKYDVAAYSLTNGELTVSLLNSDLVGTKLQTTTELQEAFKNHAADPQLFKLFGKFKKAPEGK